MGTHITDMGTHANDMGTYFYDMGTRVIDVGTHSWYTHAYAGITPHMGRYSPRWRYSPIYRGHSRFMH
jgi:hypothetical protein